MRKSKRAEKTKRGSPCPLSGCFKCTLPVLHLIGFRFSSNGAERTQPMTSYNQRQRLYITCSPSPQSWVVHSAGSDLDSSVGFLKKESADRNLVMRLSTTQLAKRYTCVHADKNTMLVLQLVYAH